MIRSAGAAAGPRCAVTGRELTTSAALTLEIASANQRFERHDPLLELVHRAVRLVHRLIRVGRGRGVGVGNRDAPEWLAANLARRLPGGPIRIPERVVLVRVTVRPAVHGNRVNVSRGVESTVFEHTRKLIPNSSLEGLERRRQQVDVTGTLLIASGQARLAGRPRHAGENRISR